MIRRAVARKFRRLTVADASSAQRLCEGVYDGRDEVPQHIASWLQNPANVVVLGLEHDETLVRRFPLAIRHGAVVVTSLLRAKHSVHLPKVQYSTVFLLLGRLLRRSRLPWAKLYGCKESTPSRVCSRSTSWSPVDKGFN